MVDRHDESTLKTFNAAKLYSEEILFPMMDLYQKYTRQSNFGAENLEQAKLYNEEIREVERFNGLKGSAEIVLSLIHTIESTVRLNKVTEQINKMEEIIGTLEKVVSLFYEHKDRFFVSSYKNGKNVESINRHYFEAVKKIITTCYVNTEMLMTKNKLLFSDSKDDFATDDEIKEQIMKEYTEG